MDEKIDIKRFVGVSMGLYDGKTGRGIFSDNAVDVSHLCDHSLTKWMVILYGEDSKGRIAQLISLYAPDDTLGSKIHWHLDATEDVWRHRLKRTNRDIVWGFDAFIMASVIVQNGNKRFTKVCTKCNKDKELREFYAHKTSKYGVSSICKCCQKEKVNKRYREDEAFRRTRKDIGRSIYSNLQKALELLKEYRKNGSSKELNKRIDKLIK